MPNTSVRHFVRILAAIVFVAPSTHAQTTRPESEKQLAREIYKQFVEIPSGFTTGATTPVAEAAAARLRAAGFSDSDIFLGGASPKKENIVVRYHGSGKEKPLLLLAHLDVVEARREDWSIDPFVLTEKDGYYYGRGTSDDKAMAAIWIATLIRFKQEGFVPNRDIIVALTSDEETGGEFNGVAWLLKEHRHLIDAALALNEGGSGRLKDGRRLYNGVGASEKVYVTFGLETHNKGGHSSAPRKDNAIYELANGLVRLEKYEFPVVLNEVTRTYFERMSKIQDGQIAADMKAVATGDATAAAR